VYSNQLSYRPSRSLKTDSRKDLGLTLVSSDPKGRQTPERR